MPGETPVNGPSTTRQEMPVQASPCDPTSAPHSSPPTADLPWNGNPEFTRKEASDALREGHPPMTPELAKQIAAAVIRGESPAMIAEEFGYAPSYANKVVSAPGVQARVRQKTTKLMDEAGLTMADQIRKLKALQEAEKVVTASHEGLITDVRSFADNGIRYRALETGLDLHGAFPTKRQYAGGDGGSKFVINIAPEYKTIFFGKEGKSPEPEEVEEPDEA